MKTKFDKSYQDFYTKVMDYLHIQAFLSILNLVVKSKVAPETTRQEWLKTLAVMHVKGWLYYGYEEGRISVVVGAYRIKEFDESKADQLPEKEEGKILYVAFMASFAKDKTIPKRLMNQYLSKNPDIEEVIFYQRNSDDSKDLKRFKVRSENDEQKESAISTGTT